MSNKPFTLYGLRRPDDDQIRYIGITCQSLRRRLYRHCGEKENNLKKDRWIGEMLPLRPEIIPYAVGLTKEEACDVEVAVISGLRKIGFDLLNITNGGQSGFAGRAFTPEHCAKLSAALKGKAFTQERRANISAAMKGKVSWHRGRKRSPETCAKISAAKLGVKIKPCTPEHRAEIAKALKGRRRSPETIAKMSASLSGRKLAPAHRDKVLAALDRWRSRVPA